MATIKRAAKKTTRAKAGKADMTSALAGGAHVGKNGEETKVTVDRRASSDRRAGAERRKKEETVAVERRALQRRVKVSRRRQIDPTTCERDYSPEELEFMSALDEYKRTSGRMFPTCSEVLEVLKRLGYEKLPVSAVSEPPQAELACQGSNTSTAV